MGTRVASLDTFCRAHLGAGVQRVEFHATSVGDVHGLHLSDGRRVVVKVHSGDADARHLTAAQRVQSSLAESGFPCPRPLLGPTALENGLAVVETLLRRGERADARDPRVRGVMAAGLATLVEICRSLTETPGLGRPFMPPEGRLFPKPHAPRFDFEGTVEDAGWIHRLALAAIGRREGRVAEPVLGHYDWRVEHLRFAGGELCAVYDWESLGVGPEPVLVGSAAHAFTADWSLDSPSRAPRLADCLAFVADYEAARGAPFGPTERKQLNAALVYALAYTARCEHSDDLTAFGSRPALRGPRRSVPAGSFRALLAEHGAELLGLPTVGEPEVG